MEIKVIRNSDAELSKPVMFYFTGHELRCKCGNCAITLVSDHAMNLLEQARALYGKPIYLTSAYRCQEYNRSLEGADLYSYHQSGCAFDIAFPSNGGDLEVLIDILKGIFPNVIVGGRYIHVDTKGED